MLPATKPDELTKTPAPQKNTPKRAPKKTHTQADLDAARAEGYAEGYAAGQASAHSGLLDELDEHITSLADVLRAGDKTRLMATVAQVVPAVRALLGK